MSDYLGMPAQRKIGENVYVENIDGSNDWRGRLLEIGDGYIVIRENGKRKLIPFGAFVNVVFTDDAGEDTKDTKPYKQ